MKKKTYRVSLMRIFWILLFAFTLTTGVLSSFMTGTQASGEARPAKFVFDAALKQSSQTVRFDSANGQIQKPGDQVTFDLEVTNQQEAAISEVTLSYEIALDLNGSMPLRCTLTEDGQEKMVWTNVEGAAAPQTFQGELAPGQGVTNHYQLTVSWPEDQNDRKFANGAALGELTIQFTAVQAD